jgi:hypothetical protein
MGLVPEALRPGRAHLDRRYRLALRSGWWEDEIHTRALFGNPREANNQMAKGSSYSLADAVPAGWPESGPTTRRRSSILVAISIVAGDDVRRRRFLPRR